MSFLSFHATQPSTPALRKTFKIPDNLYLGIATVVFNGNPCQVRFEITPAHILKADLYSNQNHYLGPKNNFNQSEIYCDGQLFTHLPPHERNTFLNDLLLNPLYRSTIQATITEEGKLQLTLQRNSLPSAPPL